MRKLLLPAIGLVFAVTGTGCGHGPLTVSPTELSAYAQRKIKVLHAAQGRSLRIGDRSSLQFERSDGTLAPWVPAEKLYTNSEGVVGWYQVPLENVRSIRIEGMQLSAREIVNKIVPAALQRITPDGSIELTLPDSQIEDYMDRIFAAVGRRWAPPLVLAPDRYCPSGPKDKQGPEWDAWLRHIERPDYPCGTRPQHLDYRAKEYLRQRLIGQPLGRWTFRVLLAGVQGPLEGTALFIAHAEGFGIPDGLRWADMRSVTVRRAAAGAEARATLAKVGVMIALAPLMLTVGIATESVQSLNPLYAFGRPRGLYRNQAMDALTEQLEPLIEQAGAAAGRASLPEDERPTGTALGREGLTMPPVAGTQSLIEGRPIPPWSPESLLFAR